MKGLLTALKIGFLSLVGCGTSQPTAVIQPTSSFLEEMLTDHNRLRAARDLPELVISDKLTERAHAHAKKLARSRRLVHSVLKAGEAENLASGTELSVQRAIKLWWRSAGHRNNILGNYSSVGFGRGTHGNEIYFVVIFGD